LPFPTAALDLAPRVAFRWSKASWFKKDDARKEKSVDVPDDEDVARAEARNLERV
jgi:hypothetical protein